MRERERESSTAPQPNFPLIDTLSHLFSMPKHFENLAPHDMRKKVPPPLIITVSHPFYSFKIITLK
jgi:hypothetical protein